MKIVVLDGYNLNPGDLSWEEIGSHGQLEVYDRTKKEDVKELIREARVVFTNKTPISGEDLEGSQVEFIGVLATGYNIIDLEATRKIGIIVSTVPTYGTRTVAQFATAMMLELSHHIGLHAQSVQEGGWIKSPDFSYQLTPQIELVGKTLAIYGMGRIAQAFAEIAQALGMEVIYNSRTKKDLDYEFVEADELFKRADFLSLHAPLTPKTQGIINKDTLALMKPSAMLINCSRGPLVVEEDLVEALNRGLIAGAALDVIEKEPMEARQRIMDTSLKNLQAFLKGEPINEV